MHASIQSQIVFFDNFNMNILNQNVRSSCQLCFFDHADPKKVIIHMLVKHTGDALFTVKCVVADCMYMTKTWTAYKQHFKCKHKLNINANNILNDLGDEFYDNDNNHGDDGE